MSLSYPPSLPPSSFLPPAPPVRNPPVTKWDDLYANDLSIPASPHKIETY
jgi:hypothetical protein